MLCALLFVAKKKKKVAEIIEEKSFEVGIISYKLFLCIQQYAWLVGAQYKPMELSKSDWAAIRKSPPWAIDSWGLGGYLVASFVEML